MESVSTRSRGDRGEREERLAALAREVVPAMRSYLLRRAAPDVADDVLGDVLLVLWRRLDDVPADHPLPWCLGVARHALANARRAERRRLGLRDRLLREPRPVDRDPTAGLAGGDEDDRHAALRAVLGTLPETDREVLRLWAWEDLEPREIAVVLGITANAVSIRLHRARTRLAERLAVRDGSDERSAGAPDRDGVKGGER